MTISGVNITVEPAIDGQFQRLQADVLRREILAWLKEPATTARLNALIREESKGMFRKAQPA